MNKKSKRDVSSLFWRSPLVCLHFLFVLYDPRFMMDWERHDMNLESAKS